MTKQTEEIAMENAVDLKNIKTVVQNGLTLIKDEELVRASLLQMAEGIPDDVEVTNESLVASRETLSEIRQARYALQNIAKANVSYLNRVKSENKEYLDELIGIIQPKEELLKEKVKEVEDEKKRIKAEKQMENQRRIESINEKVREKTSEIMKLSSICKTDTDITILHNSILEIDEKWIESLEEYAYMGENLKMQADELFKSASENLEAIKEAEARRIEQAKELEKAEAENKKRLEEIEAQRKKEREAFEAEQAKLKEENDRLAKEESIRVTKEQLSDAKEIIKKNSATMKKLGLTSNVKIPSDLTLKSGLEFIDMQNAAIEKKKQQIASEEAKEALERLKMAFSEKAGILVKDIKKFNKEVKKNKDSNGQLKNLVLVAEEAIVEINRYLN